VCLRLFSSLKAIFFFFYQTYFFGVKHTFRPLKCNLKQTLKTVADPGIHFTGDISKIIKYNDKIIFFSLYRLYFYYNMVNIIKNKNYTTIYVSQKTYLSDFINMC
jgi:hypothetical protein